MEMTMAEFKSKKINNRRYSGIKGIRPDMKEIKRTEANDRFNAWQGLTPQRQLEVLDERLGKDQGATKQRARLQAQIRKMEEAKIINLELAARKEKKT